MDIQVSESAPVDVTYVGNDPVAYPQSLGIQRRIVLTVICSSSQMKPGSQAPIGSLTQWLHTMILVRDSTKMGMTVKFPDQSLWAVQSYDLTMDAVHLPQLKVELVGVRVPVIGASPIEGIEEWMPRIKLDIHKEKEPEPKKKIERKNAFWKD